MSASTHQPAAAKQRARVLRALGVTPWVRRATRAMPIAAETPLSPPDLAAGVACVVVLPESCATRELDLLGRLLNACGSTLARAARVRVNAGQLAEVPHARAYLVFGEAQAHALGRALSAAAMQGAQIVLADELAQVLTAADAKRRLWSALRNLRRALAAAEH
ncbi:hypothetical protein [Rhodanobacter sp. BL-MT-08]